MPTEVRENVSNFKVAKELVMEGYTHAVVLEWDLDYTQVVAVTKNPEIIHKWIKDYYENELNEYHLHYVCNLNEEKNEFLDVDTGRRVFHESGGSNAWDETEIHVLISENETRKIIVKGFKSREAMQLAAHHD
jgi:hypothetical protein